MTMIQKVIDFFDIIFLNVKSVDEKRVTICPISYLNEIVKHITAQQ